MHISSEIRAMLDMVSLAWQKKIEYKDRSVYDATEYLLMQTWKLQTLRNITIIGTSVQSGNDFSTLKIKRAWFDSGGTLLKQAFVPMEKQLLLACCKVTFLCGKKRASYSC